MPDPVMPRPAATLLLLRDGAASVETLMVVRHQQLVFGSGAIVFPGGRVDRGDAPDAEQGSGPGEAAFRIAAIRETFEETGILLARRGAAAVTGEEARQIRERHRAAICAGELAFGDMLEREGLRPDVDALVPFAHWITPPDRPKRFDTHFFVAEAPAGQEAVHDGTESTESVWLSPDAVFAGAETGRYKLLFATRMNLEKLGMADDAAAALAAARASTIVTVIPETVSDIDGVRMVRIPLAAGYGSDLVASTDPPAICVRCIAAVLFALRNQK